MFRVSVAILYICKNFIKIIRMDLSLINKNALVCGGSRGIGKASAIELANLGANVTLVARTESALIEAIAELDISQGQIHSYLVLDTQNEIDIRNKLGEQVSKHEFHVLVNNTGGPPSGPIVDAQAQQFEQAFRHHLVANHIISSLLIPGMKRSGYGRIINMISTSVKQPLENLGVSNTVRGAVANWAKTLANELAPFGITVNNVLPGATRTERLNEIIQSNAAKSGKSADEVATQMKNSVPMNRIGEPNEIAAAVAFLASPAASYITGINLPVDGGRTKSL
jgi:3-oxoacyl-[acyl-carrier protein] reductase